MKRQKLVHGAIEKPYKELGLHSGLESPPPAGIVRSSARLEFPSCGLDFSASFS